MCLADARALVQLASINQPNTEENRRSLRQLLFTAPGIEKYISGVVGFNPGARSAFACSPGAP